MNKIIIILLIISTISCKKDENNTIPSYISIEEIQLDENSTHNITDAWIYINDNLQGVYEIPATFPLNEEGQQKLRIKAGIKSNGISGNRMPYPFYASYIIEQQLFQPESTLLIQPVFSYIDSVTIDVNSEDFDGNGLNLETDSLTFSIENNLSIDNNYGVLTLTDSMLYTEVLTKKIYNLPQQGAPIFLELDYKCNTQFLIGVYINFPQSLVVEKPLLWITPKEDWNKIYINLTSTISEAVGADSYTLFVILQRNFNLEENTLHFDNLKLLY